MTYFPAISLMVMTALLAGCSPSHDPAPVAESPAASLTAEEAATMAASIAASQTETSVDASGYAGKWTGVEGTSLTITPVTAGYEVVIRNLDGPRTYVGNMEADGIHIVRDKLPLVIHKGDGKDTGMKWLTDKHDCVVVMANEGYCRD
jgi:hypothetical protein